MGVVEKIREGARLHGANAIVTLIAATLGTGLAIVIAVASLGRTLGGIDARVVTLENDRRTTASQMQSLTDKVDSQTREIQRLEDQLELKGDISYSRHHWGLHSSQEPKQDAGSDIPIHY
jgi:hypothetical protein